MTGYKVIEAELITPSGRAVRFVYTNWQGVAKLRRVKPVTIFWGSTRWHPTAQWMFKAYDYDKQAERSFALKKIHPWDPINDPQPHQVLFKHGRDDEKHEVGLGYNLVRRVLAVKEIDPESNNITVELKGGRKRVFYTTGHKVNASCWLESWIKWAKTADRAWWDGELEEDEEWRP